MRSRLFNCLLLFALAASAVAAQQFKRVWLRVEPEDEEFAVHMPEPNFRIRRSVPFGEVILKPASFEITYRGAIYSVLSFSKSEPGTPKSLDAFVKGLRHALVLGTGTRVLKMEAEGETKLDGHSGRLFRLAGRDGQGAASVFETGAHFYVVLTYDASGVDATAVKHFQDSFTLTRDGTDRVPLSETVQQASPTPLKSPAPLWPVVGGGGNRVVGNADKRKRVKKPDADEIGVYLPEDVDVDLPENVERRVVRGGVLNGKVLAKPAPVYPPIAKAARAQGTVTVQILVDEEGYVIDAAAVSGHPLLQQASVFAARQSRFTPTRLEGQPVKVSGVITYNFVLQ